LSFQAASSCSRQPSLRPGDVQAPAFAVIRWIVFGTDLAIVDVMLPGIDGFEMCRRLGAIDSLPIVLLTARSDPIEVVVGLECGADDYVVKPLEPRVLDARIKGVLLRAGLPDAPASPAVVPAG
jgi:DNA-binding response OmpR family regulator